VKALLRPGSIAPRALIFAICIFLAGITWIVFGQTLGYPFLNFDDPEYVYENPHINGGLTTRGVIWAFTHVPAPDWYPLTTISHMADCQFYGLNAGGPHFTNVLLHTVTVILLFLVLRQMTGLRSNASPPQAGALWRSAFVATVFAIHPLRVESVAWVVERKGLLSGLFFMLTLGAYLRYVRKRSVARYITMSILFACGLMSKPMLVVVPLVLLLLDYWPLRRFEKRSSIRGLILEKIPLLALSAGSCLATVAGQTGAVVSMQPLPFAWRISNALVSYITYIRQMIWPVRLAVFYPHPENHLSLWQIGFAIVLLIALSAIAFLLRKDRPYLIVGWLWYLLMLVPVIGVVQINLQGHADRYTYLPEIGLYLMVAWGMADLSANWLYRRQILSSAAALAIAALAWAAWHQTTYWRDSESLWTHTIAVTPDNDFAHASLADLLLRRDRIDEAIFHSREALRIRPNNSDAHNNLALALLHAGNVQEALVHFEKSLEIQPDNMNAQCNLAWILATSSDSSLRDGAKAVELATYVARRAGHPNAIVLRTLAAGYAENGQFGEAISAAQQALQLAISQGNSPLAADLQRNIASYQMNAPLRVPERANAPRAP
jgi:tetratricopeptide (TPR) repeat protein